MVLVPRQRGSPHRLTPCTSARSPASGQGLQILTACIRLAGKLAGEATEASAEYGRQGGAPYASGDGWVIVTETLTLAEQIADALGGTAGSS
jgi:hypothetical protein